MDVDSASAEQARILAEAAHDLANRFHRFYYFAELLGRLIPAEPGDAQGYLERASHTVEDIEAMTRGVLAYLRPMEIRLVRVQVRDVVGSLRQHIGDRAIEVAGLADAGALPIAVDPTRVGEALANACRAVLAKGRDGTPLEIEVTAGPPIVIRMWSATDETEPLEFDLPLALASKILRLHGGDLEIAAQPATLLVRLPAPDQE